MGPGNAVVTDPGGTTWVGWGPLTRFAVNLTIKKLTTPHLAARCSVWSHDQPRVMTCVCTQPTNTRTAHAATTWTFNVWRRGKKHTGGSSLFALLPELVVEDGIGVGGDVVGDDVGGPVCLPCCPSLSWRTTLGLGVTSSSSALLPELVVEDDTGVGGDVQFVCFAARACRGGRRWGQGDVPKRLTCGLPGPPGRGRGTSAARGCSSPSSRTA